MPTVGDYMSKDVITMSPDDTLYDAVRIEMSNRIRHIPVVENGKVSGLVSDRDLKRAMPSVLGGNQADHAKVLNETKVSQIMTRDPTTIGPDAPLRSAVELMYTKKFGAIPVVDDDYLIGIITETDLLRAFLHLLDR